MRIATISAALLAAFVASPSFACEFHRNQASAAMQMAQAHHHGHGSGQSSGHHSGHAGHAAAIKAGAIEIGTPWSRATPGGAKVAAGYLALRNTGQAEDRLIGGTTEIAGRIELHEMATVDGTMRMRALDKGLAIAPGASVELKPGGYHLMLVDLKQPLKEGQRFKATLTFEKAGPVPVEFEVRSLGAGSHMAH